MSHSQKDEQDDLQKYLEEKAKQESEQAPEPLSAYDVCVLKESAKIHELIVAAQRMVGESLKNKQFRLNYTL